MKSSGARQTMLSAVQPTNRLTIGNYLGAIKNWVDLQNQYDCIFFAVDLHSITVKHDPVELRKNTYFALATYIACGIDPEKCLLFVQSQVPQHAELAWVLNCYTYMGELGRMTQYKDKSAKAGANIGAGLFNYPVLMAADILLYRAHVIPVGEDQKQHIEITRDIAIRMNGLYGEDLFVVPNPMIGGAGARIMDLQEPTAKMAKSASTEMGAIYLNDTDKQIETKLKRAVTDSGSEIAYHEDKPGIRNLINIQSAIMGRKTDEIVKSYAGKQYGHLKVDTAQIVIEGIRPIREETEKLLKDPAYLNGILKKGALKARERAAKVLDLVYDRVGFLGFSK